MYVKSIIKGIALAAAHNVMNLLMNIFVWLTDVYQFGNFIFYFLCPLIYILSITVCFYADTYEKQSVSCLIYIISGFIIAVLIDIFGIYRDAFQALFPGGEMAVGEGLAAIMLMIILIVSALLGIGLLFIVRAVRFKMRERNEKT